MFPVGDENRAKNAAIVTYSLIAANVAIFLYELMLQLQGRLDEFLYTFSMIPSDIAHGGALYTLVTSMFLHGGFMHIFGNMLYLYIFGNNVEDVMGKMRFVIFYLVCGFAASALQIFVDPYSTIPNLGASGAIAGVLGAYFILFPRARVRCIVFFGYFMRWITLPAAVVLGLWFVMQLFSGVGSLTEVQAGGVAYFAHVGGFVAGMVLVMFFKRR